MTWGWWVLLSVGFVGIIYWRARLKSERERAAARNALNRYQAGLPEARAWSRPTPEEDERFAARCNRSPETTRSYRHTYAPGPTAPAPAPSTVVVQGGHGSNDGLLTGLVLGNMMSGGHEHHHDVTHERIVEREVVHERAPDPEPSSSFDSPTPAYDGGAGFDSPSSDAGSFDAGSSFDGGGGGSFDGGSGGGFDGGGGSFDV